MWQFPVLRLLFVLLLVAASVPRHVAAQQQLVVQQPTSSSFEWAPATVSFPPAASLNGSCPPLVYLITASVTSSTQWRLNELSVDCSAVPTGTFAVQRTMPLNDTAWRQFYSPNTFTGPSMAVDSRGVVYIGMDYAFSVAVINPAASSALTVTSRLRIVDSTLPSSPADRLWVAVDGRGTVYAVYDKAAYTFVGGVQTGKLSHTVATTGFVLGVAITNDGLLSIAYSTHLVCFNASIYFIYVQPLPASLFPTSEITYSQLDDMYYASTFGLPTVFSIARQTTQVTSAFLPYPMYPPSTPISTNNFPTYSRVVVHWDGHSVVRYTASYSLMQVWNMSSVQVVGSFAELNPRSPRIFSDWGSSQLSYNLNDGSWIKGLSSEIGYMSAARYSAAGDLLNVYVTAPTANNAILEGELMSIFQTVQGTVWMTVYTSTSLRGQWIFSFTQNGTALTAVNAYQRGYLMWAAAWDAPLQRVVSTGLLFGLYVSLPNGTLLATGTLPPGIGQVHCVTVDLASRIYVTMGSTSAIALYDSGLSFLGWITTNLRSPNTQSYSIFAFTLHPVDQSLYVCWGGWDYLPPVVYHFLSPFAGGQQLNLSEPLYLATPQLFAWPSAVILWYATSLQVARDGTMIGRLGVADQAPLITFNITLNATSPSVASSSSSFPSPSSSSSAGGAAAASSSASTFALLPLLVLLAVVIQLHAALRRLLHRSVLHQLAALRNTGLRLHELHTLRIVVLGRVQPVQQQQRQLEHSGPRAATAFHLRQVDQRRSDSRCCPGAAGCHWLRSG